MMEPITYLIGQFQQMQAPLDRDKWLDDKEGMDFTEAPPVVPEFNFAPVVSDVADWVIILRYVAIVVLAALLIFVVVRLVSRNRSKSQSKEGAVAEVDSAKDGPTALSPLEELWAAHQKAKEEKNFKEAVRILYQIVIKHLDSQGKLTAAVDKTNREYTQEMNWQEKAKDFFQLTLLHEFTWYGSNEVNQIDFDHAEPRFLAFIESIKNG
jgi:hypothetical protein